MINFIKTFLTVIGILLLSNCASTKLTLHLDLYKEDPSIDTPLNDTQVSQIYIGLASIERETDSLKKDRIKLAENLMDTYDELYYITSKATRPNDSKENILKETAGFHEYLEQYKDKVEKKALNTKVLCNKTRNKLDSYLKITNPKVTSSEVKTDLNPSDNEDQTKLPNVSKIEVIEGIKDVYKAFIELGGLMETNFEKTLIKNWPNISRMASEKNLKNIFDNEPKILADLRQKIQNLSLTLEELSERRYSVSERASKDLNEIIGAMTISKSSDMKKSVDDIAKVVTAVPSAIGIGDRGATALNQLVQSTTLFYSQIDRMQDPADPIWRTITAPENEAKWNKEFSKSYFYAQGNSSIIIVRDTPMSFRVQRGTNNPTALIQGQLQISRALGNAALSIATATTGMPVSNMLDKDEPNNVALTKDSLSESENLTRRKTISEQKYQLRARALRNLRINLKSIKEDLQKIDHEKEQAEYNKLKTKFEAILDAHKQFFSGMQNITKK